MCSSVTRRGAECRCCESHHQRPAASVWPKKAEERPPKTGVAADRCLVPQTERCAESETPLSGHRSVTRRLTGHSRQQTSMRFTLGSSFALRSVAIALVFLITVVFLIALVFLIAGLGPAFAEVEDFRQPAGDLAQGPGLFHDADAFGIK